MGVVGNKSGESSYEKARAHVKKIKGFYNHLLIYIIFLIIWFAFIGRLFDFVGVGFGIGDADDGFFEWANINLWLNPLIWGVIVAVHAMLVFGSKSNFFKNWEARKIEKYMDEEAVETNNRYE